MHVCDISSNVRHGAGEDTAAGSLEPKSARARSAVPVSYTASGEFGALVRFESLLMDLLMDTCAVPLHALLVTA